MTARNVTYAQSATFPKILKEETKSLKRFRSTAHTVARSRANMGGTRNIAKGLKASAQAMRTKLEARARQGSTNLDVLRLTKIILVRRINEGEKGASKSFLTAALGIFEILDGSSGRKLFYAKYTEGSGEINSEGAHLDKLFCVLSLDGKELLRMDGGTNPGRKIPGGGKKGQFLVCFRGPTYIGEVTEKIQGCPARSHLILTDDKTTTVALIYPTNSQNNKCCLVKAFSKSKKLSENSSFVVHLPENHTKIGEMGEVQSLKLEVREDLQKDTFGMELSDALNFTERILQLASAFLLYNSPVKSEKTDSKIKNSIT